LGQIAVKMKSLWLFRIRNPTVNRSLKLGGFASDLQLDVKRSQDRNRFALLRNIFDNDATHRISWIANQLISKPRHIQRPVCGNTNQIDESRKQYKLRLS
jgi:hypothetical protein